jgi:hypothetical protein
MVTGSGSGINVDDGLFLDLLERSDHLRLDIRGELFKHKLDILTRLLSN